MKYQQEIDAAIDAHALWKTRLNEAINSHIIDTPLEQIARDDCCEFGVWLYSESISNADMATPRIRVLKHLHAEFHKAAGEVAAYAISRQSQNALKLIADGGRYDLASKRLIAALEDWRKILRMSPHNT